jgi:hypothetical protein
MSLTWQQILDEIAEWVFSFFQMYEDVSEADTHTGLRQTPLVSCQYWVKGLPSVCEYWEEGDPGQCTYESAEGEGRPTGYNNSHCDYLGRRPDCDKYSANNDAPDSEYRCAAPNPFLTGLYKVVIPTEEKEVDGKMVTISGSPVLHAIPKFQIKGYCDGQCDTQGRGTGCGGDPQKDPVICQYYRPWQMGFGVLSPHELVRTDKGLITQEAIDAAYAKAYDALESRLPYSFKVFNMRARFQKCLFWDDDYGSEFYLDEDNGIQLRGGVKCTNTDPAASKYKTLTTAPGGLSKWLLGDVWSDANTVICNGAKPECPCYTGKWNYCVDGKMANGLRITANQIMELRFWTSDWGSQQEYDKFFSRKPNFDDAATSAIYTYDKVTVSGTENRPIMTGWQIYMCQPAPPHLKEFDPDFYLVPKSKPITYNQYGKSEGTSAPAAQQVYFPSLIRDLDLETSHVRPLFIMYPYFAKDPFQMAPCDSRGAPICVKGTYDWETNQLNVVGHTVRNKYVYVVNSYYENISVFKREVEQLIEQSGGGWTWEKAESEDYQLNTLTLSDLKRYQLFETISNFVNKLQGDNSIAITVGQSSDTGFFNVGPVDLEFGERNDLIIFVDYGDGWDFKIRPVFSQLYGGVVYQDSFTHEYTDSSVNNAPLFFTPSAKASINVAPLITKNPHADEIIVGDIYKAYGNIYINKYYEQKEEYSYTISEVIVEDFVVEQWAQIGQSEYIWVDIEDYNLNYIFSWEFISAKMINIPKEEEEEEAGGGEQTPSEEEMECGGGKKEIELKVAYPEDGGGSILLPPAVLILTPKEDDKPRTFFKSEWRLEINYKYQDIFNDQNSTDSKGNPKELVFPQEFNDNIKFIESPFAIANSPSGGPGEQSISINNIRSATVGLFVKFVDHNGRMQAAFATKLLTQTTELKCRNVEIKYSYTANAVEYKLVPTGGQTTKIEKDAPYGTTVHAFSPPCGDHKLSHNGYGYMWYPFSDCNTIMYYYVYTGAGSCLNPYPGPDNATYQPGAGADRYSRNDYRFCGPEQYKPSVGPVGNWAANCNAQWKYYYSKTPGSEGQGMLFTGKASIVTRINEAEYLSKDPPWALPPFGNAGREIITRFLSQDYRKHLSAKGSEELYLKGQWMPFAMDNKMFATYFNPFEETHYPDAFGFSCQLNFMKAGFINEDMEIDTGSLHPAHAFKRYRFDDIFIRNHEPFCSYPETIVSKGRSTYVVLYAFKHENTAWVWQEKWEDVERGINQDEFSYGNSIREIISKSWLDFVDIEKPDYYWGINKDEHRLIIDEGEYDIIYTAPELHEEDDGGELKKWPSIQIGLNGPKRYFKILYDSYGETQVEWMDEGGGFVEGSGGATDGAPYEEAMGDEWLHDEDVIFAEEYATSKDSAADDNRKVVFGYDMFGAEDSVGYYNRGLNFKILRSDLKFLPVSADEPIAEDPILAPGTAETTYFKSEWEWPEDTSTVTMGFGTKSSYGEERICLTYAKIEGVYGSTPVENPETGQVEQVIACKPAIEVKTYTQYGTSSPETVGSQAGFAYADSIGTHKFVAEMFFPPEVDRILYNKTDYVEIVLSSFDGQRICVNSVEFLESRWVDLTESVKVWERKYVRSTGSIPEPNLDGPQQVVQFEENNDNSGQYFPTFHSQYLDKIVTYNKFRQVYSDAYHEDDEPIEVTKGNLLTVEQDEQKKLYDGAYTLDVLGDNTSYNSYLSPFLARIVEGNRPNNIVSFKGEKLQFEKTSEFNQYETGDGFWQPKGHKFQWGSKAFRTNCWYFKPAETVYDAEFVHMDTKSAETVIDPGNALYTGRREFQFKVAFGDYIVGDDEQTVIPKKPGADPEYTLGLGPGGGFA